MALHIATAWLTHTLYPMLIIILWLTYLPLDDNARPHRAHIEREFRQQGANVTFPAMSPDMNTA
jgi:hypothetical protein